MLYDAIIIGGSFAGLSAAMILARSRRRVLVIDSGRPRNRHAVHSHGVLAQDGRAAQDMLADARAQVSAYPTATLLTGEAVSASSQDGRFVVRLANGDKAESRRLLLATGVTDILPEIPGLVSRWGKTVLHCPYCHGYEIGGGRIGVLATSPGSARQASLVADWGEVIFFSAGTINLDADTLRLLANRKVTIEPVPVTALEGSGTGLEGVRLADGRLVLVRAVFLRPSTRMASPLAERAGCAFDQTPSGTIIRTDSEKLTTVPGVYAAGDAARTPNDITLASADGITAGLGLHHSLIAEDSTGQAPASLD
jgi:thioredoxin reductase